MQHEIDVVAVFFLIIDEWIIIFVDLLLMLQMLYFDVAYDDFSMLQSLLLDVVWTVRREMFLSDVWALAAPKPLFSVPREK